jgi:hypothetical protein
MRRWHYKRHDAYRPNETQDIKAKTRIEVPYDATLAARRWASRRLFFRTRHNIVNSAKGSLTSPYNTTLANRHLASRRLSSWRRLRVPNATKMSLGIPYDMTLEIDAGCRNGYRPDADTGFSILRRWDPGRHTTQRWRTDAGSNPE